VTAWVLSTLDELQLLEADIARLRRLLDQPLSVPESELGRAYRERLRVDLAALERERDGLVADQIAAEELGT
jgi:hypothetical protein